MLLLHKMVNVTALELELRGVRDEMLRVRFSESELQELRLAAKRCDLSVSELVRRA